MNLNNGTLAGRLTRDPDLRYTPTGVAVCRVTIAINRPFANQQGNREADFIPVIIWRRQAENVAEYLKKGDQIGVTYRIQTRTYEKDNETKFIVECVADNVQFGQKAQQNKSDDQSQPNQQANQQQSQNNQSSGGQQNPFDNNGEPVDLSDDDLPF